MEMKNCLSYSTISLSSLSSLCNTSHITGITPLELRFAHNPRACYGFVGACLYSNVFRFYKKHPDDDKMTCEKVIDVPSKQLDDGRLIHGMMSDILLSLDDRFLYFRYVSDNFIKANIKY